MKKENGGLAIRFLLIIENLLQHGFSVVTGYVVQKPEAIANSLQVLRRVFLLSVGYADIFTSGLCCSHYLHSVVSTTMYYKCVNGIDLLLNQLAQYLP